MKTKFKDLYSHDAQVFSRSHGRVNLIGEHTDYNDGFVLPTCIPQATDVVFRKREDQTVRMASLNMKGTEKEIFEYSLGQEKVRRKWTDYGQGVTWLLAKEGYPIGGFDCLVRSDVPMGSGLSSSAALEVALLKGLHDLFRLDLNPIQIAQLGQRVENEFVGARVGIMDQMISSLGNFGDAVFIDTRDLSTKAIRIPTDSMELLVINSGVSHNHVHGDYNQRRSECEKACELLGIQSLRELETKDLARVEALPQPFARRAKHVVTENARVLKAVEALEKKDIVSLGQLFNQSHASMRDDFEVSVPEIDCLVELCLRHSEVFGARLTGGGFGGSIVALVKAGCSAEVGRQVKAEYQKSTGRVGTILVPC